MPRILAPNHSFHRRCSQRSHSSRSSLNSETRRRSSLTSRGFDNVSYESTPSHRRRVSSQRQILTGQVNSVNHSKVNADWDLQEPRQISKPMSKDSLHTNASTAQTSSLSSSISTLPSTNNGTSASGIAAAFALLMQHKTRAGVGPDKPTEPKSVPCSPHADSTSSSSFVPTFIPKEEPDCWGQFVDVQSAIDEFDKRSRVVRRYPGAPHSLPRGY